MKKGIVVLGSTNTDMVITGRRIPVPGETVSGGTFKMNPGGKGANQAVAVARLSTKRGACTFIAKVGDDLFGRDTARRMKAYYALKYFNALFRLGKTVKATSCDSRVSVIAAVGQNGGAVFAANDSEETVPFSLDIGKMRIESCRITDEMRTDVVVPVPPELPPHSFVLLSVLPRRREGVAENEDK